MQIEKLIQLSRKTITFCLRVLIDLLSDITFSIINWKSKRVGLSPPANDILLQSGVVLARKIRQGELKSEELVTACIDRIKEINSLINAVVDQNYDEALNEARKCDKYVRSLLGDQELLDHLADRKPFFGVPFSTKEGIKVSGLHHSYGLVSRNNIRYLI